MSGAAASSHSAPPPSPAPQSPAPASPAQPAAAPATGGGGTAGLQDVLLFCLGVLAIVAGAGGIAYRRKVMRNR